MTPKLVCHRGASLVAPENTFAAAEAALEGGADLIELDVRESADGVLYVLHDRMLDRTTDGAGPIDLMTSAEIDALDAGRWFAPEFEGQRVPRLDAYLDALRGRAGAYVEIKWCDPDRAAAIIRDSGMMDRCFTFSFEAEMRAGMRRAAPEMRHMVTLTIARNVSVARSVHGASIVELVPGELRPGVVAAARAAGMEVMAFYEGRSPAVFRSFVEAGLDYINHDHLEVARAVLAEAGRAESPEA
ncbi:MAG: glycerophosphodiester phosphodiesterase [Alphaproteobacteria bacterium]|nr:MAG: glycerophosphodiester phosphodiesterase [Alphaproteobacteria bacterium]